MAPLVLITRVRDEAGPWLQSLQSAGLRAELLPLIEIGPAPDATALHALRAEAGRYAALMFVSASAVRHFFDPSLGAPIGQSLPETGPRFWATGPGTQRALIESGCDPLRIDAPAADAGQFDSEALWARVCPQLRAGQRVLIVRGADAQGHIAGRDWLALQLEAAGIQVDQIAAYTRRPPHLTSAQFERAVQAATDGSVWWFSSSEAIANLRELLPQQAWSAARALATHPRIAQAARDAGFGQVLTCRADLPELLASIESFA